MYFKIRATIDNIKRKIKDINWFNSNSINNVGCNLSCDLLRFKFSRDYWRVDSIFAFKEEKRKNLKIFVFFFLFFFFRLPFFSAYRDWPLY